MIVRRSRGAGIEIPAKFAGRPPVGPVPKSEKQTKAKATEGATDDGLARRTAAHRQR